MLNSLSSNKLGESLIGIADPVKFTDPLRVEASDYIYERIHGTPHAHGKTIKYSIIMILISAILFVTIISMYDVLRNIITYHYTEKNLKDLHNKLSQESIELSTTTNNYTLISSIIFSITSIILAIILIPLLLYIIND